MTEIVLANATKKRLKIYYKTPPLRAVIGDKIMNEEKTKVEELFDTVYQWGKHNINTDCHCETFRRLLQNVIDEAVYDLKRHGEI